MRIEKYDIFIEVPKPQYLRCLYVNQITFVPGKNANQMYNVVYRHMKRTGKEFSFKEVENGCFVRRDK